MRLRVVSDLHREFMNQAEADALADEIGEGDFDVLVAAGDCSDFGTMREAFAMLDRAARGRCVLQVLGNHEAYGASVDDSLLRARQLAARHVRWHLLERGTAMIGGVRFVACTLWFDPAKSDHRFSDFRHVRGLAEHLAWAAPESRSFLRAAVRPGDVVVTHHMPHPACVAPRYVGNSANRYFVHDVSGVVERAGAALWVHGHTHTSVDLQVGDTRVLCNPRGYQRGSVGEPNINFDPRLTCLLPGGVVERGIPGY